MVANFRVMRLKKKKNWDSNWTLSRSLSSPHPPPPQKCHFTTTWKSWRWARGVKYFAYISPLQYINRGVYSCFYLPLSPRLKIIYIPIVHTQIFGKQIYGRLKKTALLLELDYSNKESRKNMSLHDKGFLYFLNSEHNKINKNKLSLEAKQFDAAYEPFLCMCV